MSSCLRIAKCALLFFVNAKSKKTLVSDECFMKYILLGKGRIQIEWEDRQ